MIQFAKRAVKTVLLPTTALLYRNQPLSAWPVIVGRLHDVSIPRGMVPNPEPAPVGDPNINMLLDMVESTRDVSGDIAECGVYKGGTLVPMAVYLRQKRSAKRLWGFDSFQGLPDTMDVDYRLGGPHPEWRHPGEMGNTSIQLVRRKLHHFAAEDIVTLVPGFFNFTLPLHSDLRFSLVHLDCDIYESYRLCMEFFYPRMNPGGIILLDEYNDPPWPGCNQAIDEFLADKPERLQESVFDNHQKYYIVKSS
jgi:hypothetical protein